MATDTKDPSARGNTAPQHLQSQTPSSENSTAPELAAAVDELLDQLQHKFDNVSTEIYGKYDMARRLDELETSLNTSQEGSTAAKS